MCYSTIYAEMFWTPLPRHILIIFENLHPFEEFVDISINLMRLSKELDVIGLKAISLKSYDHLMM